MRLNNLYNNTQDFYEPFYKSTLDDCFLADENFILEKLSSTLKMPAETLSQIRETAEKLVIKVRDARLKQGGLDAFLSQYDLSSQEGLALMCLAEALLRIPDSDTIDKLIRDKITQADWNNHFAKSPSLFVNAATLGLMLTGKLIKPAQTQGLKKSLKNLLAKSSAFFIRSALKEAIKILGKEFVMGKNIQEAVKRSEKLAQKGYCFSYDMLGEAARTSEDAEHYFHAYLTAIESLKNNPFAGISIKLSALHPRYELFQKNNIIPLLTQKLLSLALKAKEAGIGLTVDAEEADRLAVSLDIFSRVFCDPLLDNYEGLGLAVQSYQKRAFYLIDDLAALAQSKNKKLMIRLIKGAYWDAEIKNAQFKGLSGYPVFTRKVSTDVSFLACARKIIQYGKIFYPAFATHNAYSLAAVLKMTEQTAEKNPFEFQCLHGMGYTLYDHIAGKKNLDIPCRVYAPVGAHEDLLAYLVRRLLENGANTSFVNRIINEKINIADIIADPVSRLESLADKPHPYIPLPENLYGPTRKNAVSINLANQTEIEKLFSDIHHNRSKIQEKYARLNYQIIQTDPEITLQKSAQSFYHWETLPVSQRADCLLKTAVLLEKSLAEFMAVIMEEGKKTLADALGEVREAIDFCRYYAQEAFTHIALPLTMPGPTGETNQLFLRGRGPIVCISPWNFPLAIFMGQITAALVTGNTVIAKPASQTIKIALFAVDLMHQAGIPKDVLQLLPLSGKVINEKIIADTRIKGVIFTGSTETACQINQTLAHRPGQIIPFIAETGGQNAMIVDSSALTEQVVQDVITSAFLSAGQRCSALRVLYLQNDIADKTIHMLKGAMAELKIGDPFLIDTDIGPVIDDNAKQGLISHTDKMKKTAQLIYEISLAHNLSADSFFGPCVFEINAIQDLTQEVFGPILHIIRYPANQLEKIIADINQTGYGLTMGIHSRIDENIKVIQKNIKAGNIYVNRSMTGAVVGVQPFGGEGLSGTGPKAGGPHYLLRLCTERTITINTTAAGGNTTLMSLAEN